MKLSGGLVENHSHSMRTQAHVPVALPGETWKNRISKGLTEVQKLKTGPNLLTVLNIHVERQKNIVNCSKVRIDFMLEVYRI